MRFTFGSTGFSARIANSLSLQRGHQLQDAVRHSLVNDIEHTRTKIKHPQTNGICERFQKTVLTEFYQVVLRRTLYPGLEALQRDLDQWMTEYNEARPHQGRWCYGKTPMQTFLDSLPLAKEKEIA